MAETEVADPGAEFAALMSQAASVAASEKPEAPYGYTRDRETGEMRPKKAPGRPKAPPSVDELKQDSADTPPADPPAGDRAPDQGKRKGKGKPPAADEAVPQHRPGQITKGMNKLYRRAGKFIRAMDPDIGTAVIEGTKNTAEPDENGVITEDDSVGAAWEEVARTNPRIRQFLLKMIAGGAWGSLFMAHAPIGLAIVMKPVILDHIPFSKLIASLAEPDEDTPEGEGGLPGGMTEADVHQMADVAGQMAARMGLSLPPEVAQAAAQMAANGSGGPPVVTRTQPKAAGTRAARAGKRH
jgi:hypothetical protein